MQNTSEYLDYCHDALKEDEKEILLHSYWNIVQVLFKTKCEIRKKHTKLLCMLFLYVCDIYKK